MDRQDAFWNRPASEVMGDLVFPGTRDSRPAIPSNVISLADYRSQQRPKRLRLW